jgi:hypothetical protein
VKERKERGQTTMDNHLYQQNRGNKIGTSPFFSKHGLLCRWQKNLATKKRKVQFWDLENKGNAKGTRTNRFETYK